MPKKESGSLAANELLLCRPGVLTVIFVTVLFFLAEMGGVDFFLGYR